MDTIQGLIPIWPVVQTFLRTVVMPAAHRLATDSQERGLS